MPALAIFTTVRGFVLRVGGVHYKVSEREITPTKRNATCCTRRSICCPDFFRFEYMDVLQVPSIHGLSKGLGEEFKLVHVEQVPSMRPLTDRIFEYASAQATVWRRD